MAAVGDISMDRGRFTSPNRIRVVVGRGCTGPGFGNEVRRRDAMGSILILYMSRRGHTARVARRLCESVVAAGGEAEMMDLGEARHEGVDWNRYDLVVLGAPVVYGTYDKAVFRFINDHREVLERKPNSFFNVSVVARKPEKATVEGNRYMQKFLQLSPWRPGDLKVIAGKVDYPAWNWYERLMIQMIMKFTGGPTDPSTVIDYTDWDDTRAYGEHLLGLASRARATAVT
jgi:menaquinone-dependent protoporphyrinogen oxidase